MDHIVTCMFYRFKYYKENMRTMSCFDAEFNKSYKYY